MIVLKAIGRFFARIGRWIKETAWVQPLLIVGGIFLIIFSIPYISRFFGSLFSEGDKMTSYFEGKKVSLVGANEKNSDADKLFEYILNYDSASSSDKQKYGEKLFIMFTKEGCDGCEGAYKGFTTLENNWNNDEFAKGMSDEFKLYTIFIDETDDDETKFFQTYFYETNYSNYFEEVSSAMTNSYHYINKGGNTSSYATNLEMLAGTEDFTVPTIFYVDFAYNDSSDCRQSNSLAVTEVMFTVDEKTSGSGDFGRARTLFDCFTHSGEFAKDNGEE